MKKLLLLVLFIMPVVVYGQDKANYRDTFIVVEQMPEFPDGDEAMEQYIYDNFKLPQEAYDAKVNDKIYIEFIVNPEGKMSNISLIKDKVGFGCAEEALRVFKLMASVITWQPGKQRNVRVPVKYRFPVEINYKKFDKKTLVHKKAKKED